MSVRSQNWKEKNQSRKVQPRDSYEKFQQSIFFLKAKWLIVILAGLM